MKPIILTTLNARYSHCAFGLRYLFANLKELRSQSQLMEFTIAQNPRDIAESILAHDPKLVGFGVYIWNTRQTQEVISNLKRVRPSLRIVLGGPEVSHETEMQDICKLADLTIQGEADFLFYDLCKSYLEEGVWPSRKWAAGPLPDLNKLVLPYKYYSDEDVKNRVLYVEASRGCPYKCEYCLSSLDKSVRSFDLDLFLRELDGLIQRGARQFKFVDRTFNLSAATSARILQFFLERMSLGLFLHFEMVPDRLPLELRDLIRQFPVGALQFEVGIQTWNPEVAKLVSRRQDYSKIRENFAYLNQEKRVHTHADLIAGLPGETLESFADGFDAVAALAPDEVQVGILKRLRGTPIIRHDQEWQMIYQEHAPYQVLSTKTMDFQTLQRVGRFSHFWNLVANSGNFKRTMQLLVKLSQTRADRSLFREFDEMSQALATRHPQGHGVSLHNLMKSVWIHLKDHRGVDAALLKEILIQDYNGPIRRDVPSFLKDEDPSRAPASPQSATALLNAAIPRRQRRHLEATE